MKRHIQYTILAALAALANPALQAAPLKDAKITRIINDVKTAGEGKTPKRAALDEALLPGNSVRTGIDSRTELLFSDQTITRLGANSHFSFNEGTRELSLSKGVILLQVPKGLGGAKIQTAAVTAAITGTTILFEIGPKFIKLFVIEGKCFLTPKGGNWMSRKPLSAGEGVIMEIGATKIPKPFIVNLSVLVNSSKLLTGKWGAKLEEKLIAQAVATQLRRYFGESNIGLNAIGKKPSFLSDIPPQAVLVIPVKPVTPQPAPQPAPKPAPQPPKTPPDSNPFAGP